MESGRKSGSQAGRTLQFCSAMIVAISFNLLSLALAAPQQNITPRVVVIAPACTINQGREIAVEFGDNLNAGNIDGQNYLQNIDFQLDCPGAVTPSVVMLTLAGAVSPFDITALDTNMPGLGIQILLDGVALEINKPVPIDIGHLPRMQAVPVQRNGASLVSGKIRATATLRATYL